MRHQSPRRILKGLLLLIYFPFSAYAQCDLELLEADLIQGTVTVAFNNTENCGGESSPTGISEIQFGFQAVDADCNAMNQGWDFPSGFSLNGDNNHPGWAYSPTTMDTPTNWTNLYDESVEPPYYTGDTVVFPIFNSYQSDCVDGPFANGMYCQLEGVIGYWLDQGLSIQVVIWQISYGPTMYAEDGGWAEVGANGDGTNVGSGLYEDQNFLDNWIVVGPCGDPLPEVIVDTVYVELPADTVIVLETDTVYVELPADTVIVLETDTLVVLEYDTAFIELPPDTLYVTNYDTVVEYDTITVPINWYFYDTTYIYLTDTLVVTEQVYVTQYDTVYWTVYESDTVYTYEYDMVEVDCATGLPCVEPMPECPIYIPNSFTPDNDGVNDVWGAETTSSCWQSWSLFLYSRSGELIWVSDNPDDVWLGGDEYYVPNDIYVYRVECSGFGNAYIIHGHVSLIR